MSDACVPTARCAFTVLPTSQILNRCPTGLAPGAGGTRSVKTLSVAPPDYTRKPGKGQVDTQQNAPLGDGPKIRFAKSRRLCYNGRHARRHGAMKALGVVWNNNLIETPSRA